MGHHSDTTLGNAASGIKVVVKPSDGFANGENWSPEGNGLSGKFVDIYERLTDQVNNLSIRLEDEDSYLHDDKRDKADGTITDLVKLSDTTFNMHSSTLEEAPYADLEVIGFPGPVEVDYQASELLACTLAGGWGGNLTTLHTLLTDSNDTGEPGACYSNSNGQYLTWDFGASGKKIIEIKIWNDPAGNDGGDYVMQWSDNNSNWTTASDSFIVGDDTQPSGVSWAPTDSHQYWRLYVNVTNNYPNWYGIDLFEQAYSAEGSGQITSVKADSTELLSASVDFSEEFSAATKFLLQSTGTPGNQIFTDAISEVVGNVHGSTNNSSADYKNGATSIYLDGTYDDIQFAGQDIAIAQDQDFCVELFYKYVGVGQHVGQHYILTSRPDTNYFHVEYQFGVKKVSFFMSNFDQSSWCSPTVDADLEDGAWHHIAVTRQSNTMRIYIDGVSLTVTIVHTGPVNRALADSSSPVIVGNKEANSADSINAYVDQIRISVGDSIYPDGTTFTPPTAHFSTESVGIPELITAVNTGPANADWEATTSDSGAVGTVRISSRAGDLSDAGKPFAVTSTGLVVNGGEVDNTKILFKADEDTGAVFTNLVDDATATVYDNAATSTEQVAPVASSRSYKFDGLNDYITHPLTSLGFDATQPFTLECFIYFNSGGDSEDYYIGLDNGVNNYLYLGSYESSNTLCLSTKSNGGSEEWASSAASVIVRSAWKHVAFVFDGTNINLFYDGVRVISRTGSFHSDINAGQLTIGRVKFYEAEREFYGYIDQIKLTQSILYTGTTCSVPTSAFVIAVSDTLSIGHTGIVTVKGPEVADELPAAVKLLVQADENSGSVITDQTDNDLTITNTGTPLVSSAQHALAGTTNSIELDGTERLTVDNSGGELNISSAWTFETFVRFNTLVNSESGVFSMYKDASNYMFLQGSSVFSKWQIYIKIGGVYGQLWDTIVTSSFVIDTWYHVAIVFEGTYVSVYANGVRVGYKNLSIDMSVLNGTDIFLGEAVYSGLGKLNGYIDQAQITQSAKYSGPTCTVPTEPLSTEVIVPLDSQGIFPSALVKCAGDVNYPITGISADNKILTTTGTVAADVAIEAIRYTEFYELAGPDGAVRLIDSGVINQNGISAIAPNGGTSYFSVQNDAAIYDLAFKDMAGSVVSCTTVNSTIYAAIVDRFDYDNKPKRVISYKRDITEWVVLASNLTSDHGGVDGTWYYNNGSSWVEASANNCARATAESWEAWPAAQNDHTYYDTGHANHITALEFNTEDNHPNSDKYSWVLGLASSGGNPSLANIWTRFASVLTTRQIDMSNFTIIPAIGSKSVSITNDGSALTGSIEAHILG